MKQGFRKIKQAFIWLLLFTLPCEAHIHQGSHAYNHTKAHNLKVNTATGTLSFTYPLIAALGVQRPLKVNLTYRFNAKGLFGLPTGWQLDLDHITQHTAELGGRQWLVDKLWQDETGFASGLKYFNQHGSEFLDKGQSLPVPGNPKLNYRYVFQHKDGSRRFFSHQGLLILQVDRFDNRVQFNYEEPVTSLESAKLASIKDDYGNVYQFRYEPGILTVHSADHREQRVYFNGKGVTKIENPVKQSYQITYTHQLGRNLIHTMKAPTGLITELSYGSIFYTDDDGQQQMPVVNRFKQYDQTNLKTHREAYYNYSEANNYTDPTYALSNSSDSRMDSNDQAYKYRVEVTHINDGQQLQRVYDYNYLHLPVAVQTLRQGQPYLKTTYDYANSSPKHNRSTNDDKPTKITRYLWNKSSYLPSNKTLTTYDPYGNLLSETRSIYDHKRQQWKTIETTANRYFTDHYSLLAEHTRVDLPSGRAIRKSYQLAPDGKTHSQERLACKLPPEDWHTWQQTDLTHDDKGRQRSTTRRWLAKNQTVTQSLSHHTRYQFDPTTAELTITQVKDQGPEQTRVLDTRNAQPVQTLTANTEASTHRNDALNGQRIHTNPVHHNRQLNKKTADTDGPQVTETRFRYGAFGHMIESTSTTPKGRYSVSYNYKPRGELFRQVQKLAINGQPQQEYTTEYRYDGMQRLTNEVHNTQGNRFQKRYRYDGNDNLLSEETYSNCGPSQTRQYTYNPLDQLLTVTEGKVTTTVLHDANGHLTQDHTATQYVHDDAGFLLQVQPKNQLAIRYDYWPSGLLSRHSSCDSQSLYYPDHYKNMQTVVKDGQWRSLVRHGKNIVGRQTDRGLDHFFKVNESTGAVLQQEDETQLRLHRYDAYGKPLQRNPKYDTDFTWNQELNDPYTPLIYLRHRLYHTELRRFISRDNTAIDNRYAYGLANPVNYIDPTGHNALSRYISGGITTALGLLGLFLAVPTGGASLSFTAAATVGGSIGIAAAGASLIGSQCALDTGNKTAAKALLLASHVLTALSTAGTLGAIAPELTEFIPTALENLLIQKGYINVYIPEVVRNPGMLETMGLSEDKSLASTVAPSTTLRFNAVESVNKKISNLLEKSPKTLFFEHERTEIEQIIYSHDERDLALLEAKEGSISSITSEGLSNYSISPNFSSKEDFTSLIIAFRLTGPQTDFSSAEIGLLHKGAYSLENGTGSGQTISTQLMTDETHIKPISNYYQN